MIEAAIIVLGIIGIFVGYFAYSQFSTTKKQQRIIKQELSDLINNPRYQVRGKHE